MSDVSQGPSWWQASDGKWYPPEQARGYAPPPPPPPTSGQPGHMAVRILTGVAALLVVGAAVSACSSSSKSATTTTASPTQTTTTSAAPTTTSPVNGVGSTQTVNDDATVKLIAYGPDPGNGIFKPPAGSSLVSATVEGCATSRARHSTRCISNSRWPTTQPPMQL